MRIAVQPQPLDNDVDRNNAGKSPSSQRYGNNNTIDDTMEDKSTSSITEKTVAEEEEGSTKTPAKKQQQQQRQNPSSNTAVRWEFADLGNEKEPIYFVPPNVIYCNTSNDLYQFAMNKNRRYGPIWIRMLPYLARIAVAMSSESSSSRLTADQLNTRVDEATRYFLRQKKVI